LDDRINMEKPKEGDLTLPWVVDDCTCLGRVVGCEHCDGIGWFYRNQDSGFTVSELMRDALERHG